MKKIFISTMLISGTIMGAGFCSGKEIVSYFAVFGLSSLFFIPFIFILYYFIFKLFLNLGSGGKFNTIYDINKKIFSSSSRFPNVLLFIIYLIFTSAMFAGIYQIGQNLTGGTSIFLLLISFIFAFLILMKPFEILKKINAVLIPVLIVLIFISCICGVVLFPQSNLTFEINNGFLLFFNPIIYACQGLVLTYYVLVKTGENLSGKEIKVTAFLTALILCAMQSFIIVVTNLKPELLNSSMPMLSLAVQIGFPLDIIYLIVLFVAILTTLFVTSRSLAEITSLKIKNAGLSAFLSLFLALILSFFGFDIIIGYLYPLIGIIGFYMLFSLICKSFFVNGFKFVNGKIHKSG